MHLQHHGILGMKWGVRRYQNKDGSLTPRGERRYQEDILRNKAKKKENRIDTSTPDPRRWDREDTERKKRVVDTASNLLNTAKSIERGTRLNKKHLDVDISKMSDKELRDQINRKVLERQYLSEFGKNDVSKGRERVVNAMEVAGGVLAVTGATLQIALAIKDLKGR